MKKPAIGVLSLIHIFISPSSINRANNLFRAIRVIRVCSYQIHTNNKIDFSKRLLLFLNIINNLHSKLLVSNNKLQNLILGNSFLNRTPIQAYKEYPQALSIQFPSFRRKLKTITESNRHRS